MNMWFISVSGILVMLLYVNPTLSKDTSADATIKDAILSLARVIRDHGQKIDRHQVREHRLSEGLKKSVDELIKKVSVVDTFVPHFTKIENKLSEFENLMSQRDERERIQRAKTTDSIEKLETSLEGRLIEIKNIISEVSRRVQAIEQTTTTDSVSVSSIISKLANTESHFLKKVALIETSLDTMANDNKKEATKQATKLETAFTQVQNIIGRLGKIESSLEKAQEATTKNEEEPDESTVNIGAIVQAQSIALETVTDLVRNTLNRIQDLPTTSRVQLLHNETQAALQVAENCLQSAVGDKINRMIRSIDENNNETRGSIRDLRSDVAVNAEHVNVQLHNLTESLEVIVSTANDVQNIKRNLENGISEIMSDGAVINRTLNEKIDAVANDIIHNHRTALTNLTIKINQQSTELQNIDGKLGEIKTSVETAQSAAQTEAEKPKEPTIDIGEICEKQSTALGRVAKLVQDTLNRIQNLPTTSAVQLLHNETQAALQNTTNSLQTTIDDKINRVINSVGEHNNETKHSIGDLRSELTENAEHVNEELQSLTTKCQEVMVSTANEFLNVKGKLEDGINEIISKGAVVNRTLNEKIDGISNDIIHNHSTGLTNLTIKIDQQLAEAQNINGRLEEIETSLERAQAEKPDKEICKAQSTTLENVTDIVQNTLNRIQDLPTASEVQLLHNETQAALQEARNSLQSAVNDQIKTMISGVGEHNNETKGSIEHLRSELTEKADHANAALRDLAVMVSTADEVMNIKRKLEYGIRTIITNTSDINTVLSKQIDGISNHIIDNHSKTLSNLTSKTKEELQKIWRGYDMMFQRINTNTNELQKIQDQNTAHNTDTMGAMLGMELKIDTINTHLSDVKDDVNYLTKQRSLMTQQFNALKSSLGTALSKIETACKVPEKAETPSHAGRNPIPNGYEGGFPDESNNSDTSRKLDDFNRFGQFNIN